VVDDLQSFVQNILIEWILLDPPPFESLPPIHPIRAPVDCTHQRFANVFTGERSRDPKVVVDFVPFGYDIDLLEIRLFETYDVVDAFVIYESTRTQSGWEKPLIFNLTKQERFVNFLDKVIYLHANDTDLRHYLDQTLHGLTGGGGRHKRKPKGDSWALEKAMRTEMVSRFASLKASDSSLKLHILSNLHRAFGIQNDADEIITGDVLNHFKHCEVKPNLNAREIYAPAVVYKRNFFWMERTADMVAEKSQFVHKRIMFMFCFFLP